MALPPPSACVSEVVRQLDLTLEKLRPLRSADPDAHAPAAAEWRAFADRELFFWYMRATRTPDEILAAAPEQRARLDAEAARFPLCPRRVAIEWFARAGCAEAAAAVSEVAAGYASLDHAARFPGDTRGEVLDELTRLRRVRESILTSLSVLGSDPGGRGGEKPPPAPVPIPLTSWQQIVEAINDLHGETVHPNTEATRALIRKVHDLRPGPILFGESGCQPRVDRVALQEWWRGAVADFLTATDERAAQATSAAATVGEIHPHGRTGEVVPGIDGSVKRRRRPG